MKIGVAIEAERCHELEHRALPGPRRVRRPEYGISGHAGFAFVIGISRSQCCAGLTIMKDLMQAVSIREPGGPDVLELACGPLPRKS